MRATGLISITLTTIVLATTGAAAAPWCAFYSGKMGGSENCGFATIEQCQALVWGWADGADPIHFLAQHLGPQALGGPVHRGSIGAAIGELA